MAHEVPKITPTELRQELDAGRELRLLDVREPEELFISVLPGVVPIPLGQLAERVGELDPNAAWVVICRSGGRSAEATRFLTHSGFADVRNLDGGMNRYATTVDPTLTVY